MFLLQSFATHRMGLLVLLFSSAAALDGQTATDRFLCRNGFMQVVSPDAGKISQAQCKAIADQAMAAWRFDSGEIQWSNVAELEKKPLTFRLLSVSRMKQEHPGRYGFTKGRDLFVVSLAVLDDPFAQGTLAHEIAHIQAARAMATDTWGAMVPRYFVEGHGNALGRAYRDRLHVAKHAYDSHMAHKIMNMPADQARLLLTDRTYASAKDQTDNVEAMGIFFVEYLRVRGRRQGVRDVIPRISRVFESLGRGESFDSAFRKQFGEAVERTIAEIVSLMKRTASAPAERLNGTLYEEFAGTS